MERGKYYLAWQDPESRSWWPVGLLTRDENKTYRFSYTKGAKILDDMERFEPFGNMQDLCAVYTSEDLFPLFSNRVLSSGRPEYKSILRWLDIAENDDQALSMLAMTEGIRGTDTLEVFKCPTPNNNGQFEVTFFVHGIRHLPEHCIERINSLSAGDRLLVMLDAQNEYDYWALALRTEDPLIVVGYCPRYFTKDFYTILEKCEPSDITVSVKRVNRDAPLHLRLLCKIVAPWPTDFEPCSDEVYEPVDVVETKEASEKTTKKKYAYRRAQELKVARSLRGKGATILRTSGQRSADLTTTFPSGRIWKIEVKASKGTHASPCHRDLNLRHGPTFMSGPP